MTTGSPPASRTCRRPMWKVSVPLSVRPKNGGAPGGAGGGGGRPGRGGAAPSEGAAGPGAGAPEPFGGPGVDAGVGDGVRGGTHLGQAVGRARQVGALGGEDGIGGGGRLAAGGGHGRRTLRRVTPVVTPVSGPLPRFDDVDGDRAELLRGRQQRRLGRLAHLERPPPAPR